MLTARTKRAASAPAVDPSPHCLPWIPTARVYLQAVPATAQVPAANSYDQVYVCHWLSPWLLLFMIARGWTWSTDEEPKSLPASEGPIAFAKDHAVIGAESMRHQPHQPLQPRNATHTYILYPRPLDSRSHSAPACSHLQVKVIPYWS